MNSGRRDTGGEANLGFCWSHRFEKHSNRMVAPHLAVHLAVLLTIHRFLGTPTPLQTLTPSSFRAAPLNSVSLRSCTASREPLGEKKCSASRRTCALLLSAPLLLLPRPGARWERTAIRAVRPARSSSAMWTSDSVAAIRSCRPYSLPEVGENSRWG